MYSLFYAAELSASVLRLRSDGRIYTLRRGVLLLYRCSYFVEIFRGKTYLIRPINGKRI